MTKGSDHRLYLLPFDHRASYVTGLFHLQPPLTSDDHNRVVRSKRVIYEGFLAAIDNGVVPSCAGILVDEEYGADILRDATGRGFATALSVEKSGSDEFEFEYGDAFSAHLRAFNPTFAKVLVRYNPEGDAALNQRQRDRLARLSRSCRAVQQKLMVELLVPATTAQLHGVAGDKAAYDRQIRPPLVCEAIRAFQDVGIEPDIWKIEGFDSRADCERLVEVARRDGRHGVGCIVLGRGADEKKVVTWLETAAPVEGFIGFAVGRTTFWDAVAAYEAKTITRAAAVSDIARRYRHWVTVFEAAAAATR